MSKHEEVEGIDTTTYAGKAVKALKTKARGMFGDDLLTFRLIDIVSLMLINNKFANKGIFITDDNKEESYIKIIETGDDSLITDLEKFLVLKDNIKRIESAKEEYSVLVKKLQSLSNYDDTEAVNQIVEDYLRR
jgi:hypothetical protein